MTGPTDGADAWPAAVDIVAAVQKRWMEAFGARDVEGLVDLYAEECFLFGGKPALSSRRSGVRAYFSDLPDAVVRAEFGAQSVCRLGPTVIVSAGFVDFGVDGAAPLAYRISLTFVRADGDWKIASHHASPVPGLQGEPSRQVTAHPPSRGGFPTGGRS